MDFLKSHDARSAAEKPIEYQLRDQSTGEPIFDGKTPCIVQIKGASSRTAQAELRAEEIARIKAAKDAKKGKDGEVDTQTAQDLHDMTCKAALRCIVGFKGMQTTGEDGKLRDLTREDAPAFLDLTFMSMGHLLREQNAPVRAEDETDAAFAARKEAHAAAWRKPSFAQQIVDVAQDDARFLAAFAKG